MAHIVECTLDPHVAPRRIVRRHPHHELPDLDQDTAPAGSSSVRPFSGDQFAMPAQQGVRRGDRRDLPQGRTAESVRSGGQPTAIRVRKTHAPSTKLTPQQPVLFEQVRDSVSFPSDPPAGQESEHQPHRREVDHQPQPVSPPPKTTSADLWNITASTATRPAGGSRGGRSASRAIAVCTLTRRAFVELVDTSAGSCNTYLYYMGLRCR
jgi:hypothetical protein